MKAVLKRCTFVLSDNEQKINDYEHDNAKQN